MAYRIIGLSPTPFEHLFGLSALQLAEHGTRRWIADADSRLPDRMEIRDAAQGESLILVNYEHQPAATPYRASHAISVREGASTAYDRTNVVPDALLTRMLSLRAFDAAHMMVAAELVDGRDTEPAIARLFAHRQVSYLHVHYATRGCYAARIERVLPSH